MVEQGNVRVVGRLATLAVCGAGLVLMMQCAVAATPPSHAGSAAAAPVSAGVAGDFEGKAVTGKRGGTQVHNHDKEIGWGWMATADKRMGGHSRASIALTHPGADATHGALKVGGVLKSGFISPWAGAIWFPGTHPMQASDLSDIKTLTFKVRGKPGSYSLLLMSGSTKSIPQDAAFTVTKDWTKVTIPLAASFPGADFRHVYFLAFSAAAYGKIDFELDKVQLH